MPQRGSVSLSGDAEETDVLGGKKFYKDNPNAILTGKYLTTEPSETVVVANDSEASTNSTEYEKKKQFTVGAQVQNALMRTYFGLQCTVGGPYAYGRIYKNGIAVGTIRSKQAPTYSYFTEDLTFDEADTCELWACATDSTSGRVKLFRILGEKIPNKNFTNFG